MGVAYLVHEDATEVHELKKLVSSIHQSFVHQLCVCTCVRVCALKFNFYISNNANMCNGLWIHCVPECKNIFIVNGSFRN